MSDFMKPTDNTYFLNPEEEAEMTRLILQDDLVTEGMGGLFSEYNQQLPPTLSRILDVGCGPGGWALNVAFAYPDTEVLGIDVSERMISYAMARAVTQKRQNVSFEEANVLQPLAFADASFDLVNMRFMVAALKRTTWPALLSELVRVTRPGGIIRLTEFDAVGVTTSRAVQRVLHWSYQLLHRMGYGFSPDGLDLGMTPLLGLLLAEAGCQEIRQQPHALDFSSGTALHASQYRNYENVYQQFGSAIIAAGLATEEDYWLSYEQMLSDMQQPDFRGLWYLLTCWGTKPV
jgi:ubiquinone/menaquinone biosynthesis C-methylase UbiE